MSKWSNPEEWERLRNAASCPVCLRGRPTDAVAELETSFLIASEDGPMKGYCFLLYKRHAIELYELSTEEATAFMRDVQRAAKAVHEITGAVKLNYEIHGNTIPHLHCTCFLGISEINLRTSLSILGSSRIPSTYRENLQSLLKGCGRRLLVLDEYFPPRLKTNMKNLHVRSLIGMQYGEDFGL